MERTVIDLGQTPIIKSLVERSADDRVRLAGVESVQALTYSQVITRLDLILSKLGINPPVDPDPDTGPVITTPAGISSDGTPQVGETLTGIDPVGNGPVVARRWISGASTVATTQAYTPTAAGSLRYEADIQGPDGTIATSGSTITVTAAPVAPTIFNTQGTSTLPASQVDGFTAPANALDARFAALGV